jgi:hypothetical protein
MINPQLLNYVRAQRQAGVAKEEIIKALAGGGWSAQDAQEAFAAIEGVQVPPQPPKPMPPPVITPAPAPVTQPRPMQPVAPQGAMQPPAGMQPVQPAVQPVQTSVRIQPQPVVQRQPVYTQVKKRRVWPWMLLLVLFLIGGFVGGAYAALEYPWVEDMARSIQNMISPTTLEPVMTPPEDTTSQNQLPSFMPDIDPLGSTSTGTTTTGSASTTPN